MNVTLSLQDRLPELYLMGALKHIFIELMGHVVTTVMVNDDAASSFSEVYDDKRTNALQDWLCDFLERNSNTLCARYFPQSCELKVLERAEDDIVEKVFVWLETAEVPCAEGAFDIVALPMARKELNEFMLRLYDTTVAELKEDEDENNRQPTPNCCPNCGVRL
jgi:hypothetical protein